MPRLSRENADSTVLVSMSSVCFATCNKTQDPHPYARAGKNARSLTGIGMTILGLSKLYHSVDSHQSQHHSREGGALHDAMQSFQENSLKRHGWGSSVGLPRLPLDPPPLRQAQGSGSRPVARNDRLKTGRHE
jgi:hypothetical protein